MLVVDDSTYNLFVMKTLLGELLTVRVDTAGNGQEAVDACTSNQFDVVFMDIQMPIMDGFEVKISFVHTLGN